MTPAEFAARRNALGLTPSQLAAALGVNRQSIWRWEHGHQMIPRLVALALDALQSQTQ